MIEQIPVPVETNDNGWGRPPGEGKITGGAWLELLGYLLLGLGGLIAASLILSPLVQEITLGVSLLLFVVNIVFLLGSALVVGVWRGRIQPAAIGLWPVRWKPVWLLLVLGVTLTLLPVRALLGSLVMLLLEGGADSLQMRMDIFLPGGVSLGGFLVMLLFTGLLVPLAEEMYFRGALFGWLRRNVSWPAALIGSSLLFGLGHMDSLAVAVSSFVLGLANAVLYERTRSIWVPVAVHALNNSLAIVLIYLSMLLAEQGLLPGL